jgi:hypothetical protein
MPQAPKPVVAEPVYVSPTQMLKTTLGSEHWCHGYNQMHAYHNSPNRNFVMAKGSSAQTPEQQEYKMQYDAFFQHVGVTNKWLCPEQSHCTWAVIPGHIKFAMFNAQIRFGLNWNIYEFVAKCKYVYNIVFVA